MTQPPFYVSPEQVMKDRAEYARAGIARGRSVVVLGYAEGILFVADNPSSRSLNKVSEIYDRIGFAAVGKYNEFENLRVAGIRYADLRGYSYDRSDVTARALANAYAQTLGTVFTQDQKPYEVEIVVAEVGHLAPQDRIYRLAYDGSVADEHGCVAVGGASEALNERLRAGWRPGPARPSSRCGSPPHWPRARRATARVSTRWPEPGSCKSSRGSRPPTSRRPTLN